MWKVPGGNRFQSGGLQRRPDKRVRRRDQPRGACDLAHLGRHVSGHDALDGDVGGAVFRVQFTAELLDEFLRTDRDGLLFVVMHERSKSAVERVREESPGGGELRENRGKNAIEKCFR